MIVQQGIYSEGEMIYQEQQATTLLDPRMDCQLWQVLHGYVQCSRKKEAREVRSSKLHTELYIPRCILPIGTLAVTSPTTVSR